MPGGADGTRRMTGVGVKVGTAIQVGVGVTGTGTGGAGSAVSAGARQAPIPNRLHSNSNPLAGMRMAGTANLAAKNIGQQGAPIRILPRD